MNLGQSDLPSILSLHFCSSLFEETFLQIYVYKYPLRSSFSLFFWRFLRSLPMFVGVDYMRTIFHFFSLPSWYTFDRTNLISSILQDSPLNSKQTKLGTLSLRFDITCAYILYIRIIYIHTHTHTYKYVYIIYVYIFVSFTIKRIQVYPYPTKFRELRPGSENRNTFISLLVNQDQNARRFYSTAPSG